MLRTFPLCCGVLLLFVTWPRLAGAARYTMEVAPHRPDGVFKQGEEVAFRIVVFRDGRPLIGQQVSYTITTSDGGQIAAGSGAIGAKPLIAKAKVDGPAVVTCEASYSTGGINDETSASALVAPELFKPSAPPPDDFDAFWQAQRQLLTSKPAEPTTTPAEAKDAAAILVVEVQLPTLDGVAPPLHGFLARPKDAKPQSLPAILFPQSREARDFVGIPRPSRPPLAGPPMRRPPAGAATTRTAPIGSATSQHTGVAVRAAKLRMLALEFDMDDLPSPFPVPKPGPEAAAAPAAPADRDNHFLRGAILRQMRAIDLLAQQPEWNGKVLIVQGYGVGGGLALAAAGLDQRVSLCVAGAPAMCDLAADAPGRAGWPHSTVTLGGSRAAAPATPDANAKQVARYFDAAYFAARIKCPVVMTIDFDSPVAPPAGVYAAYGSIPADANKQIIRARGGASLKEVQPQIDGIIRKHVTAISAAPR
jgi:cephalosporin-C deacetylase-like acetyl esterase